MKKFILLSAILFGFCAIAANYTRHDDVIIKNTESVGSNTTPNSKAVLDVVSTTKGFLPPRQTTTQRDAISSPTEGLYIYNSSLHAPNFYNGSAWLQTATLSGTETLTNKSISGSANTITNIPLSAFSNLGTTTTVLHGNGSGSPTFGAVSLTADVSGILPVGNGGTGIASGTSGGVPYFSGSTSIASSAALTVNQLIKGGGAGAAPATFTACSDGQIVKYASGIPACGADSTGSGTSTYRSVTTTDTATTADTVLNLSGASFTETLYTAVGNTGNILEIVDSGTSLSQVYTLNTTSGQTIGGVASGSYVLSTIGERLKLISDGANWIILSHVAETGWSSSVSAPTATSAYVFTVTAANATIGDIYSNNGQTFTVTITITGTTTLTCSGSGTPSASGTLTKVSGSGDSTIAFSSKTTTGVPVAGTTTVNSFQWRRSGTDMFFKLDLEQGAGGTDGSGTYLWPLPTGAKIDTTVVSTNGTSTSAVLGTVLGNGSVGTGAAGTASLSSYLKAFAYNENYFILADSVGTSNTMQIFGTAHSPSFANSNWQINIIGSIPISGWRP